MEKKVYIISEKYEVIKVEDLKRMKLKSLDKLLYKTDRNYANYSNFGESDLSDLIEERYQQEIPGYKNAKMQLKQMAVLKEKIKNIEAQIAKTFIPDLKIKRLIIGMTKTKGSYGGYNHKHYCLNKGKFYILSDENKKCTRYKRATDFHQLLLIALNFEESLKLIYPSFISYFMPLKNWINVNEILSSNSSPFYNANLGIIEQASGFVKAVNESRAEEAYEHNIQLIKNWDYGGQLIKTIVNEEDDQ